jgi:hypothetical protein
MLMLLTMFQGTCKSCVDEAFDVIFGIHFEL